MFRDAAREGCFHGEPRMGKGCKVVVCGLASVGKTAILEQLLYGNHNAGAESNETQEDIYVASVETDRGVREQLRVDSLESFKKVDLLKKEIDKSRDKKEVMVIVLG
ncbi:hypothetical protein MHYP_G00303590 [Metynnis hypsauchen]